MERNAHHKVQLSPTLAYRGYSFQVEDLDSFFRVYKQGVLVGTGEVDQRTAVWRWLIRPVGQRADLLYSGEGKLEAVRKLCDRWIDGEANDSN